MTNEARIRYEYFVGQEGEVHMKEDALDWYERMLIQMKWFLYLHKKYPEIVTEEIVLEHYELAEDFKSKSKI